MRRWGVGLAVALVVASGCASVDPRGLQNLPMDSRAEFMAKYDRAIALGRFHPSLGSQACREFTWEAITAASRDLACARDEDCVPLFRWVQVAGPTCLVVSSRWYESPEYRRLQHEAFACGTFWGDGRNRCSATCEAGRCTAWPTQIFPPE